MGVRLRAYTIAVALLIGVASSASGQSSLEVPIQFDFSNPGARSLALGSAFVALADDATAAFANPAGLLQLPPGWEASLEGKYQRTQTRFLTGGRLSGTASGTGIDVLSGPVYRRQPDQDFGASFTSAAYVTDTWAAVGYRHELVRIEENASSQGVFQEDRFGSLRELPNLGSRTVSVTTYGVSAARRLNDHFSFGAGLSLNRGRLDATFDRFTLPDFWGPADFSQAFRAASSVQTVKNWAGAFNAGVQWKWRSRQVSKFPNVQIGSAYRRGPSFDFTVIQGDIGNQRTRHGQFRVPDVFTAGAVLMVSPRLLVALEYSRVGYGRLQNDYVTLQAADSGKASQFTISSGNQLHLGAEYKFEKALLPMIRAGVWRDPAHGIRYTPTAARDILDERFSAYLAGDGGTTHYTFGGGVTLNAHFALNVGADLSSRSRRASSSLVWWPVSQD